MPRRRFPGYERCPSHRHEGFCSRRQRREGEPVVASILAATPHYVQEFPIIRNGGLAARWPARVQRRLPPALRRRMLSGGITATEGWGPGSVEMVEMASMQIEIKAEANGFGAEIGGVDLAGEVPEEAFEAIRAAMIRHKVLVFRDQHLDDAHHLAFARRFGPLEGHINRATRHDALPKIQIFGNVDQNGNPTGVHPERGTLVWHSDKSYVATPSMFTVLRSPSVARQGGDTLFADMARAYEDLDGARAQELENLRIVHDWKRSREKSDERPATAEEIAAAPPVEHPLVRTHPETGARALYLGNHASHVAGMDRTEGEALIAELERHGTQAKYVYRHRWRDNDVLMWDNRCTVHCVTAYDAAKERRIVHRAVVQGDRPF